jgi:hypothetical protein
VTFSTQAQIINLYKAKDGIEDARKWFKNNGMKDPHLILLATSSQEVDFSGTKIKLQIDFEHRKSQGWIYIFRDECDTTITKGVVVFKSFLNSQVIEIPYKNFIPANLKLDINLSLEKNSYFDSDIAS